MIIRGKPRPKAGDTRTVRRFAWWPLRLTPWADNVWVWMGRVVELHEWAPNYGASGSWMDWLLVRREKA
jgi:hypothetical protein